MIRHVSLLSFWAVPYRSAERHTLGPYSQKYIQLINQSGLFQTENVCSNYIILTKALNGGKTVVKSKLTVVTVLGFFIFGLFRFVFWGEKPPFWFLFPFSHPFLLAGQNAKRWAAIAVNLVTCSVIQ